jgi:fructoselysine-6-P-deglycase FrlB-like protein
MMTHGNTPLPDYMAHAGERKEHPYLMYDNILATPALMSQCLEECGEQIRHISDQIIKRGIQRFFLTGCGTSQFVGKQIAYALEQMAKMPAQAENPFEIFHYPPVELDEHAALVVISHSGNTLTDRQVAEMGRKRGAFVICFTDNPQATLLPYVDEAVIGPGGRDMAIPKTRSYTTSLLRGMMLVSDIARTKGLAGFDDEIEKLPQLAAKTIADNEEKVKHLVAEWKDIDRYFAVGAGPNAWTGMESALKIMETIGFPAFGFELEEYTHGPELSLSKQNGISFSSLILPLLDVL